MELLFESRLDILSTEGKMYFSQTKPEILPEPVMELDSGSLHDGGGMTVEGTVLNDGGILRMWYNAWPKDWDGENVNLVGYAESDDGIAWRKPILGQVEYGGSKANNLVNLAFCLPSVFIDPTAPPSHRYRATGNLDKGQPAFGTHIIEPGYYTAHSSDGLHWELDGPTPRWYSNDVITSIYHPQQERGIAAMKYTPRVINIPRRSIWEATLRAGKWSDPISALLPDEFDDVCAAARGFASGDYYGMGMMPAGSGTVGFIWQFRHTLPRTEGRGVGVFGAVDISLAYQSNEGDRWLHSPGREDFIKHGAAPWNAGAIYTATSPVKMGDEQWLYFGGWLRSHGWYVDERWNISAELRDMMVREGVVRIGLARWPQDRLFGFHSDPDGILTLDLGEWAGPSELFLNYQAETGGSIRVELSDAAGYDLDNAVPLIGDHLNTPVAWTGGTKITPPPGQRVTAKLHMHRAKVYAYDVRPLG